MGQSKSRSQNTEPVQFVPIQLPIKQDSIFLARGKLSDESEIKISTQTDGLFKNLFAWKEESNCDNGWGYIVFVDRSFEMKTKTGEMIKIAIILSYDTPKTISFKVKIIQGANLFTKMKVMKFTYAHGGKKGYFGTGSTPGIVYTYIRSVRFLILFSFGAFEFFHGCSGRKVHVALPL